MSSMKWIQKEKGHLRKSLLGQRILIMGFDFTGAVVSKNGVGVGSGSQAHLEQ